jgi:hypothetical protein
LLKAINVLLPSVETITKEPLILSDDPKEKAEFLGQGVRLPA